MGMKEVEPRVLSPHRLGHMIQHVKIHHGDPGDKVGRGKPIRVNPVDVDTVDVLIVRCARKIASHDGDVDPAFRQGTGQIEDMRRDTTDDLAGDRNQC